ncbi:hypothetical protein BDF14DRAFT_575041 [Spinellus fusiger]|nr:hypothetical protein BDF14DRAFT_575041 [Spinellus fusiger]
MDTIDDFILSLAKPGDVGYTTTEDFQQESAKDETVVETPAPVKNISESEDEENAYSDDENNNKSSDDEANSEGVDEYGPDLYRDEDDRKRLLALPEVERERILSERSEERQRNLERLEVRKLLKDGRRDDITRRSTRAKETTTSRALSELTRRREEKSKGHSKRHRKDSPSPDRRKRRKSHYSEGSDYENSDDERDGSADEVKKREPTLKELHSICLKREMIEKWLHTPFFEQTVIGKPSNTAEELILYHQGCYVRLLIGPDPQTKKLVYRLCQVQDIVSYHKVYKVAPDVYSNKAIKAKHGNAEKVFPMDIVSNSLPEQYEYARLCTTLETEKLPGPTIEYVQRKTKDMKHALDYVLNDKEVAEMIAKKKAVSGLSGNGAMEKAALLARLGDAKSNNDADKIARITKMLQQLDENASYHISTDGRQHIWADLNKRNRERDRIEVHEAEIRQSEGRRRAFLASTQAHANKNKQALSTPGTSPQQTPGASGHSLVISKTLSKEAIQVGRSTATKSGYEDLLSKVSASMEIQFDDDDD